MKFNRLKILLLSLSLVWLAGCATRPPSAAIFMMTEKKQEASQDSSTSKGVGGASLIGLVNLKENPYEINKEWNVNVAVQNGYRYGYFAYGFGLQLLNPYAYIGFASEHFGAIAWSNIFPLMSLFDEPNDMERDLFENNMGFGVSFVEQFDLSNGKKIGLTQHFSRTAAAYTAHSGGFPANWPSVFYYYECGGGGYVTIPLQKNALGIELRYSRNLTYKTNQLSLVLSLIS